MACGNVEKLIFFSGYLDFPAKFLANFPRWSTKVPIAFYARLQGYSTHLMQHRAGSSIKK